MVLPNKSKPQEKHGYIRVISQVLRPEKWKLLVTAFFVLVYLMDVALVKAYESASEPYIMDTGDEAFGVLKSLTYEVVFKHYNDSSGAAEARESLKFWESKTNVTQAEVKKLDQRWKPMLTPLSAVDGILVGWTCGNRTTTKTFTGDSIWETMGCWHILTTTPLEVIEFLCKTTVLIGELATAGNMTEPQQKEYLYSLIKSHPLGKIESCEDLAPEHAPEMEKIKQSTAKIAAATIVKFSAIIAAEIYVLISILIWAWRKFFNTGRRQKSQISVPVRPLPDKE